MSDDKNPFSKISPFVKKDSKFYTSSFKDDFTTGLSQIFLPKNGTWTFSSTDIKEIKPVIINNFLENTEEKSIYSQFLDIDGKTQAVIIFHHSFIERYLHYSMGGNLKTEIQSQSPTKKKSIELSKFNIKVIENLSLSLSKVIEFSLSKSISLNKKISNEVYIHQNLIKVDAPTHAFYHMEFWLKEDNSSFDLLLRSENF